MLWHVVLCQNTMKSAAEALRAQRPNEYTMRADTGAGIIYSRGVSVLRFDRASRKLVPRAAGTLVSKSALRYPQAARGQGLRP